MTEFVVRLLASVVWFAVVLVVLGMALIPSMALLSALLRGLR